MVSPLDDFSTVFYDRDIDWIELWFFSALFNYYPWYWKLCQEYYVVT